MVISATGALTIAARALSELAEPFDTCERDPGLLHEMHQERLEQAQPRLAAYPLETFARHLELLSKAVGAVNVTTVAQFFNTYIFD